MIGLAFALLFLPCCAALAGAVLHLTHRRDELDSDTLVRHFVVLLVSLALVAWGISRTKPVRVLVDPEFALQTKLDETPVYAAVRDGSREDHQVLHRLLVGAANDGHSVPDALVAARPILTRLAEEHLDFAKPDIRVAWARVSAASLREAQRHGARHCHDLVMGVTAAEGQAAVRFSAENTATFQRALTALYESRSHPVDPMARLAAPAIDREEFNRERAAIRDGVEARFGPDIASYVRKHRPAPAPEALFDAVCEARLHQLDAMLAHPTPLASELLRDIW